MGRLGSLEVLTQDRSLGEPPADEDRRAAGREVLERVRENLDLLQRADRLLLKMHWEARSSLDEIAQITGMDRSTVCRRIQRLLLRLSDETYLRCARDRASFSAAELTVIRDHFLRGWSLVRISRDRPLGLYRVRAIIRRARRCAGAVQDYSVRKGEERWRSTT